MELDSPIAEAEESSAAVASGKGSSEKRSLVLLIVWAVLTLAFLIASFAPEATVYEERIGAQPAGPVKSLTSRVQFDGLRPTNSIAAFSISVAFNQAVVDRKLDVSFTGRASSLDFSGSEITGYDISNIETFEVKPGETEFLLPPFLASSRVNFASMSIALDAISSFQCLTGLKVIATTIGSDLVVTGVALISVAAVSVGILLLIVVPRNTPTRLDHWFIIFVAGALFFIDGPWLLLQFYALPLFSQVFDVMPHLFHVVFLWFVCALFRTRTTGLCQKLFMHWILYASIAIMQVIMIALQFWGTGGRSLAMYALYRNYKYGSFIALVVLFIIFHGGVITGMIFGFVNLRIQGLITLVMLLFMVCVGEAIPIITFLIRVFCSPKNIGLAVAADLFYVIEANLLAVFLLLAVPHLKDDVVDDLE